MTGRLANFAGTSLNDRVGPKSNVSSTSYRSCSSRSRTIRVVIIGRVAHPSGPSRRRAVCIVVVGRVAHRRGPSRRRAVRVVVVGRVAHPVGGSPRRAVCASVLRPLRLRHVRTGDNGKRAVTILIVIFSFSFSKN